MMTKNSDAILTIQNLMVKRKTNAGKVIPTNHLNLSLSKGEALGIVGESGSGKTTIAYAIMGLLEKSAKVSGSILYHGTDLLTVSAKDMESIRGPQIGMIFQNPMLSLDPSFRVGQLLREVVMTHTNLSRSKAEELCLAQLRRVGFSDPKAVAKKYPFELSGGMCQRVMIAMVLVLSPEIIIADEPTTALDVTIQEGIMSLLRTILEEDKKTLLFITHNFGLVAEVCHKVAVLYGGSMVEYGTTEAIFNKPLHPYTQGLLKAIPPARYQGKVALTPIEGTPLDLTDMPSGCPFSPRCSRCTAKCLEKQPPLFEYEDGHTIACWQYKKEGGHSHE